jgi:DNA-binding NarL/FixJ family response regulator
MEGLKFFLSGFHDLAVQGEAATGMFAVRLARKIRPDLVLLDWHVPDMSGTTIVCSLRNEVPELKVLVYSASHENQVVEAALKAGADGFLCKSARPEVVVEAIRAVASGRRYFQDDVFEDQSDEDRVEAHDLKEENGAAMRSLTRREMEIARLVGTGNSNLNIAAKLDISEQTVKLHLNSVFGKLGLASRLQLALWIHGIPCQQEDHLG